MYKEKVDCVILLRPHHLLCLQGYKGKSYSTLSKQNWDIISEKIVQNPDMKVKFNMGPDTLCIKCPAKTMHNFMCKENYVLELDKKVKNLLNLKENFVYIYSKLIEQLKNILDEKKHAKICGDCSWRNSGLCVDTFKKIKK